MAASREAACTVARGLVDDVIMEGPDDAPELILFIHGWPDDLHLWDALSSDLLQTGRYRCLRCTLPGFGTRHGKAGVPALDPNFYEAAQLLEGVVQAYRQGEEQVTLVQHDWGSWVGLQFQRQYPGLVRRMVMMDIGPMDNLGCLMTAAMGAYYQWWNAIAYLLWRYVPLVGKALGDCMHRVSIRRFKREVWNVGPADQSASAAYFYHYFQKDYCLSCFGRSNPNTPPAGGGDVDPSCPALFLYGDAGLGRHFRPWFDQLRMRDDCDVQAIPGNHWFMLQSPEATSAVVREWLALPADRGGKLKAEVMRPSVQNV